MKSCIALLTMFFREVALANGTFEYGARQPGYAGTDAMLINPFWAIVGILVTAVVFLTFYLILRKQEQREQKHEFKNKAV